VNTKIICNIHAQIGTLTQQLFKLDYNNTTLKSEIDEIATELLRLIDLATDAGQSMEDRLKEYRNAIEKLGFKRNKNGILDYQVKQLKDKIAELGIELNKYKKI